jgi:predicted O-linked N-acetylglucosamine transferase (SPINDLY family)
MPTLAQAMNAAIAMQQSGKLAEAQRVYEQILAAVPGHAPALHLLGVLHHQRGEHTEAARRIRQALAIDANQPDAQFNLGCALAGGGDLNAAERAYRAAIALQPRHVPARINLGNLLRQRGQSAEALTHYQAAVDGASTPAVVHFHLGNALADLDRHDEAIASYRRAVAINPQYAEAFNNLGTSLLGRDADEAIESFERALALKPGHGPARANLARALDARGVQRLEAGEFDAGVRDVQRLLQLEPTDARQVRLALALPTIPPSVQAIDEHRRRLEASLDAMLARADLRIDDPVTEVRATPFLLAYHGRDDRALMQKLCAVYRRACPGLTFKSPPPPRRDRRRVLFVGRHLHRDSIGPFMQGWIAGLDRRRFEVWVGRLPQARDEVADAIDASADGAVELPEDFADCRSAIADLAADVIIYPDLGMEALSYFLAYARLAPLQCAWWGHPVTTGIDSIDAFLSSAMLERGPEAQADYSERLVRLPTMACYPRPRLPEGTRSRRQMGFSDDDHLYFCPQSLFKLQPDFDELAAGVLERDDKGKLVLFDGRHPAWRAALEQRMARRLGPLMRQVVVLPRQPFSAYLGLVAAADVLLDTTHFTGGNTSLQSLALGTPVVTLPGDYLRGRMTLACYRAMEMTDLIATSAQGYVEAAVRVVCDGDFRAAMREAIAQRCEVLFDRRESAAELGDALGELAR